MKFSILFPSKGRPELCAKAIKAIRDTQEWDNEILLGLDTGDVEYPDLGVKKYHFYSLGAAEKVFRMQKDATGDYFIIGSDDLICVTPGWDRILASRFPDDGIAGLYHRDSLGEHKGSTGMVITRRWYETAGYVPQYFRHFYMDTWVMEIAKRIDRLIYVDDVIIEHRHPKHGLAKWDDTYASRGAADAPTWRATEPERIQLAKNLKSLIGTPWIKSGEGKSVRQPA